GLSTPLPLGFTESRPITCQAPQIARAWRIERRINAAVQVQVGLPQIAIHQAKPLRWTASLLRPSSIEGGRPRGLSMIKHTILIVGSIGMGWALAACNT